MVPSNDLILQVIHNGIFYYDRFGKVSSMWEPNVSLETITQTKSGRKCSFRWEDLGSKFWLSEEEAKEKAQEYLSSFSPKLTISILKKICKLSEYGDTFYSKDANRVDECRPDYLWYDKLRKALVVAYEYDNGLYTDAYSEEYSISEYGITWALTRKELEE